MSSQKIILKDFKVGDILSLRIGNEEKKIKITKRTKSRNVIKRFNQWLKITTTHDIKVESYYK